MILAVDTSTQAMGVAVYHQDALMGELTWSTSNHHSVELAPAVQFLLQRCKCAPQDLELLAVATGPGSFTSLRIGLAFIKGMSLSLRIPVIGIPTLDITAAGVPLNNELPLVTVLQVGRSRLAAGRYAVLPQAAMWKATDACEMMDFETLAGQFKKPTLVCGELTKTQRAALARKKKNVILSAPSDAVRRPAHLAELAFKRWRAGDVDDSANLAPIYLQVNDPLLTP